MALYPATHLVETPVHFSLTSLLVVAAIFCVPVPAHAQAAPLKISGSAALKAKAKVSGDSAVRIASRQVPTGTIQAGELEMEGGKLVYTFEIKVPGKSGIDEVNVDALTGAIVAHEHESPAVMANEAKAEASKVKAAKNAKRKPPTK